MVRPILLITIVFILGSCGGNNDQTEKKENQNTSNQEPSKKVEINDACDLVSEQSIKELFDPQNELTIDNSSRNFPTCTYKWQSNKDIEKEVAGRTISYQGENRVMIVLGSDQADASFFKRSIDVYNDAEKLDLADQSVWSENMHQLTILENNFLIHINVEFFDQEGVNKDKALILADLIIAQLS